MKVQKQVIAPFTKGQFEWAECSKCNTLHLNPPGTAPCAKCGAELISTGGGGYVTSAEQIAVIKRSWNNA